MGNNPFALLLADDFLTFEDLGVTADLASVFEISGKTQLSVMEVLPNWLGKQAVSKCSIRINETSLAGRRIFVYAGNMGVAQGLGIILELADKLRNRRDIGFFDGWAWWQIINPHR